MCDWTKKQYQVCVESQGIKMPNNIQSEQLDYRSCRQWNRMAFGTFVRNSDGNANVPYVNWNGSEWNRNANWLDNDWNSNYRVVLLATIYCFSHLYLGVCFLKSGFAIQRAFFQFLLEEKR